MFFFLLRSQFKSNLVSIWGITGGPQRPSGHLVHTEEIQLKNQESPLQKWMMKLLKDKTLNFFPLQRRGICHQQHTQIL